MKAGQRAAVLRGFGVAALLLWAGLSPGLITLPLADAFHRAALLSLLVIAGALALLPPAGRLFVRGLLLPRAPVFVGVVAAVAAGLSLALVRGPLREQVLALDASVYLFEARALSHLHLGAPVPPPALPFGARFLFEGPDGAMYGVFPPGYPLFLAPFVLLGKPMLAGPLTAVALVVAQYLLGRQATGDELAARLSLLLSLPAFARAIETADLLSHAFVAALSALAVALALRALDRPSARLAALIGAACGWAFAARLLDGLVLAAVIAPLLAFGVRRRGLPPRLVAVALAAALPFVALLAAEQKAATGSFTTPTQSEYFVRSDYPPTCHRLGFGKDVGCAVEHPSEREAFGPEGYSPGSARRVIGERALGLGRDLFGFTPFIWLGFWLLALRPSPREAVLGAYALLLTLGYGLFYYGNAPVFGARHLFPAAPFLYVLVARFATTLPARKPAGWLDAPHLQGAAGLALLFTGTLAQLERWRHTRLEIAAHQAPRADLRAEIDRAGAPAGLFVTPDPYTFIAAFDPRADGPARAVAVDDRSELRDLRRTLPDPLAVFVSRPPGPFERLSLQRPRRGLWVEMESAWPSFQRPSGLAARRINTQPVVGMASSGEQALGVFVSAPGASLAMPFFVAEAGSYSLRIDGFVGPEFGDYEVSLDGAPLLTLRGYEARPAPRPGEPAPPRFLAEGRHELVLRCSGKAAESRGYLALWDVLAGEPAP